LPGTIPKDTTVCSWPDRAEDFLKSLGVLKKELVGFGDNTFVRKAGAWAALPS
jgi:hypothetical protein